MTSSPLAHPRSMGVVRVYTVIVSPCETYADRLVRTIRRSSRLSRGNSESILNMSIAAASKVHPVLKVTAAVGKELGQMDPHDV